MALPAIAPYTLPTAAELPQNKVSWTPDPKRAVLLIHDMQNHFVKTFTAGQPPVTDLVANIQRLRQHCTALGIPVVYSAQPGGQSIEQRGLLLDFWGMGIAADPGPEQIIDALKPAEGDIHLTKWRYSAFRRTGLMELLKQKGRDQLIITGIYAHIGCLQTASDGFMSEIQPFLVADALGDFSREQHLMALNYAAKLCAVTTVTDRLIEMLGPAGAGKFSPQSVREEVAELLVQPPSELGDDENLLDRGLDSIRIMSLVERWRRKGVEVTFVELAERPTLTDWYALLSSGARPPESVTTR